MVFSWEEGRGGPKTRSAIAATYKPDKALDRLIAAIERDATLGSRLSPTERMRLGYYVQSKAAFEQEQAEGK